MRERLLCEGTLRVSMSGTGERTLLAIHDRTTFRFWTDTSTVESLFANEPVRLDTFGAECLLRLRDDSVEVTFRREYEPWRTCRFSSRDLDEGVAELKFCGIRSEHLF